MQSTAQEQNIGMIPMDNLIGVSNRLEKGQMEKMMIQTLDDLSEVLKDHCGPYGKYAAITSPVNPSAEPIFTKDGINIIRSIDYVSHIQQFIRHTLMYMGSRIESTAGDGTTSAMIIMAVAMRELIKNLKEHSCTYQQLKDIYRTRIVEVMEREYKNRWGYQVDTGSLGEQLKASKEAGEDLDKEVIRYIAYSQAYTSSHGDIELSTIIADLFANTPRQVWELFSIEKAAYETSKDYLVDTEHCQWKVEECALFPLDQMTDDFGTKSIRTGVTTIITDRGIAVGDDYTKPVREQIEQSIEAGTPLTVIVTGNLDTATNMWLTSLFQKHPSHGISIYMVPPGDYGMWNDLPYMKIASGQPPVETMTFTLDYKFNGRDLVITKGLYEDPTQDDSCHMHPFYHNDQYPVYNDFVEKLDQMIKMQSSVVATRESNKSVAQMKKMLSKLIVVNRNYFRIGGCAYDNAAAIDVAVDVLTAVKNSLINGCTFGSNLSLLHFFYDLKEKTTEESFDLEDDITKCISDAFITAIEETFRAMFRYTSVLQQPDDAEVECLLKREVPFNIIDMEDDRAGEFSTFYDMCCSQMPDKPAAILQPIDTDFAIVKRFGEIALRFVKTARIVSEGGIYLNDKKKES